MITSGALFAGFTVAAGALDGTAVLEAIFFAAGAATLDATTVLEAVFLAAVAAALDAGAGVVFLVEVVTVFFGVDALVLACVLEID